MDLITPGYDFSNFSEKYARYLGFPAAAMRSSISAALKTTAR